MSTGDAPADTRMMAIVHSALKRDLRRTREVLATSPPPQGQQRRALGGHVTWMMEFLHAHHRGEDLGLWPLVRAAQSLGSRAPRLPRGRPRAHRSRRPRGQRCGPRVHGHHGGPPARGPGRDARPAPRPCSCRTSTARWPTGCPSWQPASPHANGMRWSRSTTSSRSRSPQLGIEGHWLLEGIDAEGYDVVVHKVPPVPRFVLVHGFGPVYRRQARARWTPAPSRREAEVP